MATNTNADEHGQWSVKHRPRSIDEMLLPKQVKSQLNALISKPKSAHAILMVGQSGCGKTTAAKIVAHALTKSTPGKPCSDITESNTGSDRGIADIRNLVESSKRLPWTKGARRVFLLDEAHALTGQSMSALLKPLEEPSPHVTWILATDRPEKLEPQLLNRCLTVRVPTPPTDDVKKMLLGVLDKEKALRKATKKERALLCKSIAVAADNVPRAALQMLQAAVDAADDYASIKELIDGPVVRSPVVEVNRAAAKIVVALMLAAQDGRDVRKPILKALAEVDAHPLLSRLLTLMTGLFFEEATGVQQNATYFFRQAFGKVDLQAINYDHMTVFYRHLVQAHSRAVTFTVDTRALVVAACLDTYAELSRPKSGVKKMSSKKGRK